MARPRSTDVLQNYAFWLTDISVSARAPFFTLGGGLYGFSAVTSPEVSIDAGAINALGDPYPEHTFGKASVAQITLSRRSAPWDSTMWQWISRSIRGVDRVERDLLLLHFIGLSIDASGAEQPNPVPLGAGGIEIVRGFGKGWILHSCIPTRYKAGSDFDATDGGVSIQELDVQPKRFTEFSLDPLMLLDLG